MIRSKDNVFIALVIIEILFISMTIGYSQENRVSAIKESAQEVTIYLRTGEIIKGILIQEVNDGIIIEKQGNILRFERGEILKAEDSKTGVVIPTIKKLPFKQAIITYEYEGGQTGKGVVYIDTEKNKIALETNCTQAQSINKDNITILYDGEIMYTVDLDKNEAIKTEMKGDIISDIFNEDLYLIQSDETKEESFLGKDCKVYRGFWGEAYFWQGIVLKGNFSGYPTDFTKQAIDIQLDAAIPSGKFDLPKGIQVTTREEQGKKWEDEIKKWKDESKKHEEEFKEEQKKELFEQSQKDPEIKKILDASTKEDGTIDLEKFQQLIQEKEKNELIEEAKNLEGGEKLLQEVTSTDGIVDTYKLARLVMEKEDELRRKEDKVRQQCQDLIREADEDRYKKKYPEALEKYTKAIELYPSDNWSYLGRQQLFTITGDYQKAIEDLNIIIETDKDIDLVYQAQCDRADIYLFLEKYQQAIDDYTKCIEMTPQQIFKEELRTKRGDAYRRTGEYQKALVDFNEAIEKIIDEPYKENTYFLRGLVYKQMGKDAQMRSDWEKAEELGSKLMEGLDLNAIYEGHFIWYFANGNIKIEGNYRAGEKQGLFKWYYPNGDRQSEVNYVDGKAKGKGISYYRDGAGGHIESEFYFKNDKKNGERKSYYENGNLKDIGNYQDDLEEGEYKWYYENGVLKEKNFFKNGRLQGTHYFYYESGKLKEECPYENGKENGVCVIYNEDGSLKKKIIFENGKRIKDIYN